MEATVDSHQEDMKVRLEAWLRKMEANLQKLGIKMKAHTEQLEANEEKT
jgi:hypothetical protein